MSYAAEPDPYCYPGTTILRNLLDIRSAAVLEEAELAFFLVRSEETFPEGAFDVLYYRAVHRHLFQDLYAWAGETRTVRIGKGGNWFCYPEYISSELERTFSELGDPALLVGEEPHAIAARLAHFLSDLNAIHPFREGNGRTQLAFLAMLAERAGYPFNADVLEKERVISAMVRSFGGDEQPLAALVLELIS